MSNQFSWTKQWYPVSPIDYLESSRPNPLTLLGKNLVLWKDKNKKWIAMDDRCPHRLVKLSLGSINHEVGTLICRYHGWCFDSEGKCIKIPMSTDEKAEKTACESLRSKVQIYPTQVTQDLLWIWPDDSPTAFDDCRLKSPATIAECNMDLSSVGWHMTEVPVGYTVSVENTFDPSHAQFLHEGIGVFAPKTAVPMQDFQLVGEMSAEAGFTLQHKGYNIFNKEMDATRKFTPPCSNSTIYRYPNGKKAMFQLYFIPVKPGYCRYIGKFIFDGNINREKLWLKMLPKNLRIGLQHLQGYKLGDQDISALSSQEVACSKLQSTWSNAYYLPTPSDVGAIGFRRWLDKFASGGPEWEGNVKELPDEKLYDRWHRHTKLCPNCRSSVALLEKVRVFCQNCTKIFLLVALLLLLTGIPVKLAIGFTILGIMSLLGSSMADDMRHNFISSIPKRGLPGLNLWEDETVADRLGKMSVNPTDD